MKNNKTAVLVQLSLLIAIELVMFLTPLGYLKMGVVSITFMTIPVVIGAAVIGPAAGAVLGLVFGITSFSQCFGADAFGTTLFGINGFYTAVMCLVPRVLMGWLAGVIFNAIKDKNDTLAAFVSCFSGAALNTILFVGSLILFFGKTDYIMSFGENIIQVLGVLITANTVIEAIACTIIGGAVSKAVIKFARK